MANQIGSTEIWFRTRNARSIFHLDEFLIKRIKLAENAFTGVWSLVAWTPENKIHFLFSRNEWENNMWATAGC